MIGNCIRYAWCTLATTVMLVTSQAPICIAQDQFQYRQHITRDNGLPSDKVNVITQDTKGFMWLGTDAGLARYDGTSFKIYKNDPNDSTSLVDNWISAIEQIGDHLWVGTALGISVLNLSTDKFKNYYLDNHNNKIPYNTEKTYGASLIYHDRLGETWIFLRKSSDNQWCKYIPETDDFECYDLASISLNQNVLVPQNLFNVLSIHRDNVLDNILWVGTGAGLIKFDIETGTTRHFYYPQSSGQFQVSFNTFRRLWQGPDQKLYCGSWSGGLNIFDPITEEYYPAPYSNNDMPGAFLQSIREISRKSESEIWVTLFKSLVAYDFIDHRITLRLESDFASDEVYGADFIDKDGRIWSRIKGMHVFDPRLQQFKYTSYAAENPNGEGFTFSVISDTTRDRLTVLSRDCDGLYHYYPKTDLWEKTTFSDPINSTQRFEGNNAVAISENEIIVSASHSIFRYFPKTDRMEAVDLGIPIQLNSFNRIDKDKNGMIWISTADEGILKWDPKTNKTIQFLDELKGNSGYRSADVKYIDSQNNVWITQGSDLFKYSNSKGTFVNMSVRNPLLSEIKEIDEDGYGRLWISNLKYSHLVNVNNTLSRIDTTIIVGNRSSRLLDMHYDNANNMWAIHSTHIINIDPLSFERVVYSTRYLQDYFEVVSSQIINGHYLVLGLPNGLITINLRNLNPNTEQPIPYLSGIEVKDNPFKSDLVPHNIKSLDLKYSENFFSLTFSALGYTENAENTFRYRLTNFQEDWIEARDHRFANYTNVPSGSYVFELQVFNSEGDLSPQTVVLPITISKHWSQLWIVRILGFFLIIALGVGLYKYRINQIKKEERLKTEFQKKLAEVEMTALQSQMNPHFIFNCLNSIENFVIKNDTLRASTYLNDFARLIRLILQNSRSRYVALTDEIEALELYLQMESLRFTNRFNYELLVEDNVDASGTEIPPMLIQPYVENAIWHGLMHKKTTGRLDILLSRKNETIQCVIEDNGIGREKSMEINAARKVKKKKSMGMSITAERIKILNELYNMNTEVKIDDLKDTGGNSLGTRVEINISV